MNSRIYTYMKCLLSVGIIIVMGSTYNFAEANNAQWGDLSQKITAAIQDSDLALAEDIARKRIEVATTLGPKNREARMGNALRGLASVLRLRGNYNEAEPLARKAQGLIDTGNGKLSHQAIRNLGSTGMILMHTARYAEAEVLALEANARVQAYAPHSIDAVEIYNLLGKISEHLHRFDDAENWLNKAQQTDVSTEALDTNDNHFGPYWINKRRADTLYTFSLIELKKGRLDKAESYIHQAIEKFQAISSETHFDVLKAKILYGTILVRLDKYAEAELVLKEAVKNSEQVMGGNHPETARAVFYLAQAIARQGRANEAEPLFSRAIKIVKQEEMLDRFAHFGQAKIRFLNKTGKPLDGIGLEREVLDAVDKLFAQTRGLDESTREGFVGQFGSYYLEAVSLMQDLHKAYPNSGYDREALAIVSRTQSRIFSELLRQSDVSGLSGVREFTDLYKRQGKLNKRIEELKQSKAIVSRKVYSNDEGGNVEASAKKYDDAIVQERIDSAVAKVRKETLETTNDLAVVEASLWDKFPRYMEMAQPRPVTVDLLQKKLLKPNEKLITYFLLPDSALAFVVSRDEYQVVQMPAARADIAAMVVAARAPEESVANSGFAGLSKLDPILLNKLYASLFLPLEPYLKDAKRVLVIADGPLYNLPLEMLVTRYGEQEKKAFDSAKASRQIELSEYSTLPYLGERYRFAYLPSLSALASMRLYHKPQVKYERELVSFADPVFEKKSDSTPMLDMLTRGMRKGGTLNIPRLPETAEEAKEISAIVGGKSEVYLRENAQENTVKTIDLKNTRYLHFATHGLLSGEFSDLKDAYATAESQSSKAGNQRSLTRVKSVEANAIDKEELGAGPVASTEKGEPALLLSLSGDMKGEDGLLTMREILSKLDLNAKLVVLSACNTAGEGAEANNGEGFAGLTRSFMYAGAQGLLVSHWSVESQATKELMTNTFRNLQTRPDSLEAVDHARVKIRGSTASFNGKTVSRAHPYFWAPFVFVGE